MKKLLLLFITIFIVSYSFSQVTVVSTTNVSCPGMCNGGVTFSTSAPGPYTLTYGCSTTSTVTFSSSPFVLTALCACPNYNFFLSNSLGIIGFANATISTPAPLNAIITKTNICCFGLCNGALNAFVIGGTSPYTYTWVPIGANTPSISGLCAGNYTLLVKDNNGCNGSYTSTITQPAPLSLSITKTLTSTSSACDGQIQGMDAGGTAPYNYTLAPGGSNSSGTFTNLCNGTYTLCTTDNGCCITCATVAITTSTVTGVQNNNSLLAGIEIYPNPASDKVVLKTDLKDVFVELTDARGKIVKQEKLIDNSLTVSELAEGIYFLNIKTKESTLRKQIVIAR